MPLTIYKGTTKKLYVELLDRVKDQIDPEDPLITEVEASIRHVVTKKEYAKFSTKVREGYKLAVVETGKVRLLLDVDETSVMDVGEVSITVLIHSTDVLFDSGEAVNPAQGILAHVKDL
jgi:hypothetical protein